MRRPACLLGAALCGLAISAPLAARDVELAEEIPLNAEQIIVELWNAELSIVVTSKARPVLRTEATEQGYSIDVVLALPIMTLRRTAGAGTEDEDRSLRVKMLVAPTQQVHVHGTGLVVTVESAADVREARAAPAGSPRIAFSIEDSQLELTAVCDLAIEASGSSVFLSGTRGPLALTLRTATVEVRGHQGDLSLATTDTEVLLDDVEGAVLANLEGGSLRMDGGAGTWNGEARDALLLWSGWDGNLELKAHDSTFEARVARIHPAEWKIVGHNTQVVLERIEGPLVAVDLSAGSLDASALKAKIRLVGKGRATVELIDLDGDVELKLSDGAEARLTNVSGAVQGTVEDGLLEVNGSERLALTGTRSEISVRGVRNLRRLAVTDSELVLDLGRVAGNPAIQLQGQSNAEVFLPPPCAVRVNSSVAAVSRVNVSGCDLHLQGTWAGQARSRLPRGERPLVLTVTLSEDSTLDAEGRH